MAMASVPPSRVSKKRNLQLLSELDKHKAEIEFLYCVEQLTLKQLIEDINGRYGLNGTLYQYRDRLAAWGCRRTVKKAEWIEIHKQLLKRERLGSQSEVYLNNITNISMDKIKRGLSRNITATDKIFMNSNVALRTLDVRQVAASNTGQTTEYSISVRSPSSWSSIALLPTPRMIPPCVLKNLPIMVTENHLLRILQPMVRQHPLGSNQISTININKYHVFLRTLVYSISNNLVWRGDINRQLDLVNELGYRRPLMALLSQKLTSIAAVCESLLPLLYLREDEELLLHIRKNQPGSVSYFSILSSALDISCFNLISREGSMRGIRRLLNELLTLNIQAKSFSDARKLFEASSELGDFTPFLELTAPGLVLSVISSLAANRDVSHWHIADWPQTEKLLVAGFRYGFEAKLLEVLVFEDSMPTSHFWRDWWEATESSKLPKLTMQLSWTVKEFQEFDRIFMVAVQTMNDFCTDLLRRRVPRLSCWTDISRYLLHKTIPTTALYFWEIDLIARLIELNPDTLEFFTKFLQHKYPDVEFQTCLFHIILRQNLVHDSPYTAFPLYRRGNAYGIDALRRLLEPGFGVNLMMDSIDPPITYIFSRNPLLKDGWTDFHSELLDLLISEGTNIDDVLLNHELRYCVDCHSDTCRYNPNTRAIDYAFWDNRGDRFCYLLEKNASLDFFPVTPIEHVKRKGPIQTPCPLFLQAVYQRDLEYVSKNWRSRFRLEDCDAPAPSAKLETIEWFRSLSSGILEVEQVLDLCISHNYSPSFKEVNELIWALSAKKPTGEPDSEESDIQLGLKVLAMGFEREVLEHGSNPRVQRGDWGYGSLEVSILYGNVTIMEYLLELGKDPLFYKYDFNISHNLSAVQFAAQGSFDCLKALVDRGLDINQPPAPNNGSTALHQAINSGNLRIIAYLLHKGADIYAYDSGSPPRSALEYAIRLGRLDAVSLILQVEPTCQEFALSLAEKHDETTIAKYVRDWTPSSHENTTAADIEMLS